MTDETCDCCKAEPSVGVAAVPGIPMSIAWGKKCLEAGVIPYDLLVINTALAGGYHGVAEWWQELIDLTCAYFDKSVSQFRIDVDKEVLAQYEEERAYYEAHRNDPPIDLNGPWDDV